MPGRTFKYRMYPTKKQTIILLHWLNVCRYLYNELLADRKNAYDRCGIGLNCNQQAGQLKYPNLDLYSQVAQDLIRRLDTAFRNFFRRVRNGEEPGYPRFQEKNRYDSFTYPQSGFKIMPCPAGSGIDGSLQVDPLGTRGLRGINACGDGCMSSRKEAGSPVTCSGEEVTALISLLFQA
ncbi:MAG: transposase, partial [Euryarchaeota archaeon]|nr:transposase [Euryarchaeota archaeon]